MKISNIESFVSQLNQRKVAKANRFSMTIYPVGSLASSILLPSMGEYVAGQALSFQCEAVTLPGRAFNTTERKTHGPITKMPYSSNFNEITATFRLSENMGEKDLFSQWMNLIQDPENGEFSYQDDYISTIYIRHYPEHSENYLQNASSYKLMKAYPVSVADVDFDASSSEYAKLTVTFAYQKWLMD